MIRRALCSLLAIVLAAPCLADAPKPDRHVVLISVDGLPASMIDDPQASMPAIRGLARSGVRARRGMSVSNPSVTWPNHTSLVTGVHPDVHGVLFNGLAVRGEAGQLPKVVSASTQADLVRVPLLFDELKAGGLTSSAINWPCTRGSASIGVNFPDVPDQLDYTTPALKAKLAELPRFEDGNGIVRDEIWTEAACRTLVDDRPNLLALHLLIVDSTHHRNGPQSPEGYTAVALADANVGKVLDAIGRAGLRESTTVLVVSDHGFARVPRSIRPNALLRREGMVEVEGGKPRSARAWVISEGGVGMVYLADPSSKADLDRVRKLFEGREGVAAVLGAADFPAYHLPDPARHAGMADLVLVARDGYNVSGESDGDDWAEASGKGNVGAHGFISTEPKMDATFVASGRGIRAGADLDRASNVDVAPTVRRILGVAPVAGAGRALDEILDDAAGR